MSNVVPGRTDFSINHFEMLRGKTEPCTNCTGFKDSKYVRMEKHPLLRICVSCRSVWAVVGDDLVYLHTYTEEEELRRHALEGRDGLFLLVNIP